MRFTGHRKYVGESVWDRCKRERDAWRARWTWMSAREAAERNAGVLSWIGK